MSQVETGSIPSTSSRVARGKRQQSTDGATSNEQTTPTQEIHALREIIGALPSNLGLDNVLDKVVNSVTKALGYSMAAVVVLDKRTNDLSVRSVATEPLPVTAGRELVERLRSVSVPCTETDNLVVQSAQSGKVLLTHSLHDVFKPFIDPATATSAQKSTHIATLAIIPLLVRDDLVGSLLVGTTRPAISPEDLNALHAFANQAAIAIENARLYEEAQHKLNDLAILFEASTSIVSSLQLDELLPKVTQLMARAAGVDRCAIFNWERQEGLMTLIATYPPPDADQPADQEKSYELASYPPLAQPLATGEPLLVSADDPALDRQQQALLASRDTKTLLCLPLQAKGQVTGLVELYADRKARSFTQSDVELCQNLANQAAVAIENARLYQETERRLSEVSTLYRLANQMTSSLELPKVLDAIVNLLRQTFNCRGCTLFLVNRETGMLEIRAASGVKHHWIKSAKLRPGEGISGQVAATAQATYIPDTRRDPGFLYFDEEVRSLLVVPVISQNRVIGTLSVDDSQPNAFTPDREQLLTIAAAQAAIAIENARLFEETVSEKHRTEAIINHMADGLIMLDQHYSVVSFNPAMERMLGLKAEQVLGKNVFGQEVEPELAPLAAICQLQSPEMVECWKAKPGDTSRCPDCPAYEQNDRRCWLHLARETDDEGHPLPCRECPVYQKNYAIYENMGVLESEIHLPGPRDRFLRVYSSIVKDSDGRPLGEVKVVRDITKERELDRMKSDFISTISHELRTPLFSIQGFVRLILDGQVPDVKTQRDFLTVVEEQAGQLAELVNSLLDLSRLESGVLEMKWERVQIADVIRQTVTKLEGLARSKKIALQVDVPKDLPEVEGDAMRLGQVIANLIGNALKFTASGGRVSVSAEANDSELSVHVADSGVGIPPDALERVFDKFYQASEATTRTADGTGLGLYIAKNIVETHGGRIWAKSEVGRGSVFSLALPLHPYRP